MTLKEKIDDWTTLQFAQSKNELKPTLNYKKFDSEKEIIVPLGDLHLGSKFFDEDLLKYNLEWCYKHKAKLILMGDMVETATKDSVGAGVYEQSEILDKQIEHFLYLFKPLAKEKLILGIHPGNHEFRVYKHSGLNIIKSMARELKIKYFDWGKLHYLVVGNQGYTLYSTHGASGARLPHTKIKGALDLANLVEAEIYCMGHLHQLSHHVRNFYNVDKRSKKVIESQKHFLLTGSYLTHWGSYAHMKSYEPMRKGSPKIKLSGVEHSIRVSL